MRRILSILLILFTGYHMQAQEVTSLSLQDCMDYALKHNYTIKNARLDVQIQKAQNNETLAAAYPHVNGKSEFDDFYVPQQSFIDASTFAFPGSPAVAKGTIEAFQFTLPYAASASITTSQLIFDGGVLIALKARNSVMEFARLNSEVTEETIRYNVYKAYNSLVIAYRQYDIIKKSLVYARSLEHDITVTQQNGFAEKIDVERTNVQVNNLATDSIRIGNLLTTSEQVLKYQMGMDISKPIVLTDTAIEERRQSAMALINEQEQYDRVPEYNAMRAALTLNEFNLRRYKLAAIPTLNAFWTYGSNYGAEEFDNLLKFDRYWSSSIIGVQLNVPIFNGFMRTNQVEEAKLNIEKSQNNIESVKQTIDFQSAQGRTSLKNALLETQSQRSNLEVANDVLNLAQKKYKAGVGSNLEVTQAQTDQLNAETNYFNALLDVINAEADLKKALGLLK